MKNTTKQNAFMKTVYMFIAIGSIFTAAAQSSKDAKFAKCASEDGMMEVEISKVALAKSTMSEIKMHAQHMIDDHGKANDELKSLAAKKNIPLPTSISDKKQKKQDKLAQLNGKDFDKKFAKCMVHAHKKALCSFKKAAKKSDDAELKSWAAGKVPVLESHLAMWKETCKNAKKA